MDTKYDGASEEQQNRVNRRADKQRDGTAPPSSSAARRVEANKESAEGNPMAAKTNNQSSKPNPSKKLLTKEMTKAERRELQERQRAEKAALRGTTTTTASSTATRKNDQKLQPASTNSSVNNRAKATSLNNSNDRTSNNQSLQLFLHLDPPPTIDSLLDSQRSNPILHPSILRLARLYAEFKIVGSNARCLAMLEAFKPVIQSYMPPSGTSLTRHLPSHLTHQINHLVRARPLSVSMGNAIRHLKGVITRISVDVPDDKAKQQLFDRIDLFIRDRIIFADKVIQSHAIQKIKEGDVIMTYSNSSVIQGVLLESNRQGIKFRVIVVDSRPTYEGKNLLRLLSKVGVDCTYVLIGSIGSVIRAVDLLLIGAHSILANGSIYSRAGTALVSMICKSNGIPVLCCCETYKFSERVMLDSIVSNEIGTSQSTIPPSSFHYLFNFQSILPQPITTTETDSTNKRLEKLSLGETQGNEDEDDDRETVKELSLLYDVTRPEDVTMVVTEAGIIPVQSVPVLLRDYKPLLAE
ncbi:hypothetical protein BY996DRAFT_6433480 [Phakopsora pachyrhizi]|nr:hypothetical protein BY996DRAFT_6433480 [Phakopsora pachyrhizi]